MDLMSQFEMIPLVGLSFNVMNVGRINIGDKIVVVHTSFCNIAVGAVGEITKVFAQGIAAKFTNITHPMLGGSNFRSDMPERIDIELWLKHGRDYKLYEPTESTTEPVQIGAAS